MKVAKPPQDFTEKEFDALLFGSQHGVAPTLGWLSYHTLRSKGSQAGYPDRTLVRERIVFAELKTMERASKPSERQRDWLDRLAKAGGEVYLWRPGDVDDVGVILGRRWRYVPGENGDAPRLIDSEGNGATPRSLWVPGVGRAELAYGP